MPLTSNEMSVESDDMLEPTTALDTTILMARRLTPRHRANRMPKCCSSRTVFPTSMTSGSQPTMHRTNNPRIPRKHAAQRANQPNPQTRRANERRRRLAETAASRQSFGIGGVGHHSLHSPAKFQSDVRRQATPDPRLHRGGRLRARRRHARPRRSAICSQAQLTSQHFRP